MKTILSVKATKYVIGILSIISASASMYYILVMY